MAITFSRPTMNNMELIEIGEYLGCDETELLDLESMLGDSPKNLELLKILSDKEQILSWKTTH
ncbi:ankyrin repeat protein [Legionella sainthelensi]|uniref:Ankyrin repeat protein n=1 Tax=Legionella sainthelensi TaxID=28087 RepID=A0A0W0YC04_9GAMM|nr:hypothetical protein [Legionella sainthelensi]KTD54150.1 ankyrin repeat protein [Legionella sainthelensi]VEH29548.1 ankyrin repeat protein [Legionella sainthelensi]